MKLVWKHTSMEHTAEIDVLTDTYQSFFPSVELLLFAIKIVFLMYFALETSFHLTFLFVQRNKKETAKTLLKIWIGVKVNFFSREIVKQKLQNVKTLKNRNTLQFITGTIFLMHNLKLFKSGWINEFYSIIVLFALKSKLSATPPQP